MTQLPVQERKEINFPALARKTGRGYRTPFRLMLKKREL
jgi:hypothetical protein